MLRSRSVLQVAVSRTISHQQQFGKRRSAVGATTSCCTRNSTSPYSGRTTTLFFPFHGQQQQQQQQAFWGKDWRRALSTTTTTTTPTSSNNNNNNNCQQESWRTSRSTHLASLAAAATTTTTTTTTSANTSLWWNWYLLFAKIPKGFENFFPKDYDGHPTTQKKSSSSTDTSTEPKKASSDNDQSTSSSSSSSSESSTLHSKNDNSSKKKQQNKQETPPPPPPNNNDDTANIPGLLVLLVAIIAIRQYLEDQEAELGQEITWQDFRHQFLWPRKVEKLQVVNRNLARVVLKPGVVPVTTGGSSSEGESVLEFDTGSSSSSTSAAVAAAAATSTRTSHGNRHRKNDSHYYFYIGSVEAFEEKLTKAQHDIHPSDWVEVEYVTRTNWVLEAVKLLPFWAFLAAVTFGLRGMGGLPGGAGGAGGSGGPGNIFSIGRSTARKISKEDVSVSFKDVAGCDQAKMEIKEFVDFLQDSERFSKLGAKIPKGALLCGPPGTGKTLLAKAVAGEAGVPFYSISGSDFIEMFVGVGPSRVRDLFKEARNNAPCIVFIDEIDAVGRQRGRGGFSGGGNDERENTLNQLLVEMDGFSPTTGVVVLAGTNRADILDKALTRPGRFDRQIVVDRPDLQGRKEIFQVHLQGIKLEGDIDEYAGRLAGLTPGFAGADIANICNEAAIVAARRKADSVSIEDFEKATDRIIGGIESHKIMSFEERNIVAHHEAGHAIAGWFLEHADPLLKVTIIPRASGALGFAQYLPKEVFLRSQDQIMDIVCMALAGRASEEVFFGRVTTGASDDLRRVTQLVYSTIKDFGMNSKVGQLAFPSDDNSFGDKPYSDSTAEAMDDEARNIVDEAYKRTLGLIRERKAEVEKVAQLLLEKETITHDDIVDLVGPRPFAHDTAYQQYVSSRAAGKKEGEDSSATKEDSSQEGKGKEADTTNDEAGLTPGLA